MFTRTSGTPTVRSPATITWKATFTVNEAKKNYNIRVYTGNIKNAGTDANVFIKLFGSKGETSVVALDKSLKNKDPFERGQIDYFNVKTNDLGVIYKLKICHDNTGIFPGWHLNKIIIEDTDSKQKFTFTFYDWLFKGSHGQLEHEIEVDGTPVIDVSYPFLQNSTEHHTSKFVLESNPGTMILRRGQTFKVQLKLAREYRGAVDEFYFLLKTGKRPRVNDKSLVTVQEIQLKDFQKLIDRGTKWGFRITKFEEEGSLITTEIFIPPTALPARYDITIEDNDGVIYQPNGQCVILFNPWCKEDEVYMSSDDERREYVLRQHGQIYRGSWSYPRPCDWYFGQFEEVSLEAVFNILENEKAANRDIAAEVARLLSAKCNSCDNKGVLEGNWSGEYDGGRKPTSWNSSPAILESFIKNESSVKFGQCWVFSAVITTLMRTIGIPCRPVTNFISAHDSDGNCSNDKYFDRNGEPINDQSEDSVWNFHVWNDVWMSRKDLPPGYGGWQAVDATPQEKSQGLFQMGPASLVAVKEGEIDLKYDTAFVFAEVNADTIYWLKRENGEWEAVHRDRTSVGKRISTKAVGSNQRNDITDEYKFPEGSVLERASVRNALLKSNNAAVKAARKDVEIDIETMESYPAGEDLDVSIQVKNTCDEMRSLKLLWKVFIIRYDGVLIKQIETQEKYITLKPHEGNKVFLKISAVTLAYYISDESMIRIQATGCVDKTKQLLVSDHVISVSKPELQFNRLPKLAKSGKSFSFEVMFTNPLSKHLTDCELYLDGTIIKNRKEFKVAESIEAKSLFKYTIMVTPDLVGGTNKKKSMAVSFSCKELGGLSGFTKIAVSDE